MLQSRMLQFSLRYPRNLKTLDRIGLFDNYVWNEFLELESIGYNYAISK